ncbi:hypothetical protein WSM22_04070 [Cytophagales bacterium WSM2-2]|nr:hypothetical protein WSM22_04070 [Cytophagales bacterium WSM2-2]
MDTLINRREAIRKTAMLMGTALTASMISFLESCKNIPDLNYKPVFFNEDQARLVSEVAEIILPKTDTPGAKDVGVPNFIDMLVKECYKQEDQKKFIDGLNEFDQGANKKYGNRFIECSSGEREAYVIETHKDAIAAVKNDKSLPRPFILKMKELTMLAYFTSEPGATKVLQYNQVPGAYHGCIPLSEAGNGKTWA